MSLKNLPLTDRPREKLLGGEVLSLQELLAILLNTGMKGKSVLLLAQEMLDRFGGLEGLIDASIAELTEMKGVGKAKAIHLKAAFEISRLFSKLDLPEEKYIQTPLDTYNLVKEEMRRKNQEVMMVVLKDIRKKLIHCETVSVGTLAETLAHPREVFYPAIRHKAYSFVLVHNHPSGDPTPSTRDLDITRHLLAVSKLLMIPLDDHIIIGASSYISLKEKGFI